MKLTQKHLTAFLIIALVITLSLLMGFVGYFIGTKENQVDKAKIDFDFKTEDEGNSETVSEEKTPAEFENEFYSLKVGENYTTGYYYVKTEKDPLNIRKDPSQDSAKQGMIPIDTRINVQDSSSNWGYITYNGTSGWINLNYCIPETLRFVWVTIDGDCYHLPFCETIQKYDSIQVKCDDAIDILGRRACQECIMQYYDMD